jgi:23S rRNA (adenine2030-N6)-methyltransferase
MLAYRHAFHAGNHADVLKHIVLVLALKYMNQKEKTYRLIDTHAGAGGYSLEGPYAQKKNEYQQGIARLWQRDDAPPGVSDYVRLVKTFNSNGKLSQYPGSPALAQMLLRAQDQWRLFERHPTDHRILASYLADVPGVQVFDDDGFEGLKAHVPPPSRRALILMDPSYEGHGDYSRVISSLRDAVARFPQGVYMVWYPQVQKLESAELPRRLAALAPKSWLHVRLTVQVPDTQGFGLAGSGVFMLNPPFSLHDELARALPYLVDVLGQYDLAHYLLEHKAV